MEMEALFLALVLLLSPASLEMLLMALALSVCTKAIQLSLDVHATLANLGRPTLQPHLPHGLSQTSQLLSRRPHFLFGHAPD